MQWCSEKARETLYTLQLFESFFVDDMVGKPNTITRVPGGWIFENIFIPYNEEFKIEILKEKELYFFVKMEDSFLNKLKRIPITKDEYIAETGYNDKLVRNARRPLYREEYNMVEALKVQEYRFSGKDNIQRRILDLNSENEIKVEDEELKEFYFGFLK